MEKRVPRILMGKPGLCGHDRGIMLVIMALRDAGMEVIYSGRHNSPEQLVDVAVQEDVDVLGVSILSGAHMALVPRVMELLRANGQEDVLVFVGGIIPEEDVPPLLEMGVHAVYGPGTPTGAVAEDIQKSVAARAA